MDYTFKLPLVVEGAIDKSGYPEGPWSEEPDFIMDYDSEYGIFVIRRTAIFGNLCGYAVILNEDHPYFLAPHTTALTNELVVHGGITYVGRVPTGTLSTVGLHEEAEAISKLRRVGFDCAHGTDYIPFGPTLAYFLSPPTTYKDWLFVKDQCLSLLEQLSELGSVMS